MAIDALNILLFLIVKVRKKTQFSQSTKKTTLFDNLFLIKKNTSNPLWVNKKKKYEKIKINLIFSLNKITLNKKIRHYLCDQILVRIFMYISSQL